ncbi:insulin-like growth factor 1 receptor [Calliphora vicina]|uniref:insulin-like growth factor 1 receptor n=1 Tax=Calliphora vicina TaxID=7373 RepID=UPI00325A53C4
MQKYLSLLFILYICCACHYQANAKQKDAPFKEVRCNSATIRSLKDFDKLQNCTVVTGHVRIVHMHFTAELLARVNSSNIEEISEYLLVYRVEGLDSLERLFPKLVVIRGVELLYDQYALTVLENRDLLNIGLVNLLRVLKGSIRVESNPSLCFTHTINWVSILGNNTKQFYYVMKNNKSPNQCPLCYTYQDELKTIEVNRHKKCWSLGKFQKTTLDYIGGKKCYKQGGRSSCLTSCFDNNCRHCTNYVSDRGCVENCLPPKYRLAFKRQCVSDCSQWKLKQLGMECVEECPKHYQEVKKNDKISCALNCTGNFVVHSIEDLEGLADCTTIEGSLTIEFYEINKPIIQNLEQAFRHLNEITGYLKILNSPQIVSLHFFKNLHTIRGLELIENRYSLYVVDNQYLEELWIGRVAILHGCVYFHLNPSLCYEKITDLKENFKECQRITIKDASRNSNGERVVCGPDKRDLTANITDYNSNSAVVQVDLMSSEEFSLLIGYVYYYKEAHDRNVTKFDGRHGCGRDGWLTDVVVTHRRRHILRNMKPATQYAYFVKSMTTMDYPYLAEHVSEIKYFQTEPAKPGLVAKMYTHSLSTKEIEVHWWPPRMANGIIEKYILQYEATNETMPSETTTQSKEDLCQCPKLDAESIIPTPHVDNYHNKEQWLYKDALSNFLFQKSQTTEQKPSAKSDSNDTGEARVSMAISQLEEQNTKKQEEAKEMYILPHPYPVCNQSNPNIQDQAENKCIPLDRYDGAIEIPSHRHSYILNNLSPEITYRISLRACVKDLANGCGAENVILAETVSKRLETILENLSLHKL